MSLCVPVIPIFRDQVLNKSPYVRKYRHGAAFKRFVVELSQQVLLLVVLILFTPLICYEGIDVYLTTYKSPAIQVGIEDLLSMDVDNSICWWIVAFLCMGFERWI